MTAFRPGRGVHIIADRQITHGKPHFQGNLVGIVQKQDEPGSFDPLNTRTLVQAGIKYFLVVKGETEVAALAGATLGAAVWISTADDSLSLTDDGTHVPFGRVSGLPGTFGLPSNLMRVDMDLKDTVPNA